MAVASAESTEPQDVLGRHLPLSRDSLKEREVVEALWRETEQNSKTGAASLYECAEVYRAFEHTPAHTYEIATALDYYGVCDMPNEKTSAAFRAGIERHA